MLPVFFSVSSRNVRKIVTYSAATVKGGVGTFPDSYTGIDRTTVLAQLSRS